MSIARLIQRFSPRPTSFSSPAAKILFTSFGSASYHNNHPPPFDSSPKPTFFAPFLLSTRLFSTGIHDKANTEETKNQFYCESNEEEDEDVSEWEEEEDDDEPEVGDGGGGGGVVLQGVPWGDRVLSIANDVLKQFGDDMKMYAFKTTPRGYIYVRLDKLSNQYGCPSMEELESYSREYKKGLDEAGTLKEIPDDLAISVSSPGAERVLKVPDDLCRFKDMPMTVCYVEDMEFKSLEKCGVFMLDSIETEQGMCVWKLANVKENRDPKCKGKPLNRKQKDWRLKLPYTAHQKINLYLEY